MSDYGWFCGVLGGNGLLVGFLLVTVAWFVWFNYLPRPTRSLKNKNVLITGMCVYAFHEDRHRLIVDGDRVCQ